MNDRVDHFCDNLRDKLKGIEQRLAGFRAEIDHERTATRIVVDQKIEQATIALARIKDDAEAARARMISQEQKRLKVADPVVEWKHNRELDKLERLAEDAEAYASWSLLVASGAISEAELAVMQAIGAREDVEQAATN